MRRGEAVGIVRLGQASRQRGIVDGDRIRAGRQELEQVATVGICRCRHDLVDPVAVDISLQRHGHVLDAQLGWILDPVAVQIHPHGVADRSGPSVAEVLVAVVLVLGQVMVGRVRRAEAVGVERLAEAVGQGRIVDGDRVVAGGKVIEQVRAARVGRHVGGVVDRAVAVEIPLENHRDVRDPVLVWVLDTISVGIEPDPVADRADPRVAVERQRVGAIAFADRCARVGGDGVRAVPTAVGAARRIVEDHLLRLPGRKSDRRAVDRQAAARAGQPEDDARGVAAADVLDRCGDRGGPDAAVDRRVDRGDDEIGQVRRDRGEAERIVRAVALADLVARVDLESSRVGAVVGTEPLRQDVRRERDHGTSGRGNVIRHGLGPRVDDSAGAIRIFVDRDPEDVGIGHIGATDVGYRDVGIKRRLAVDRTADRRDGAGDLEIGQCRGERLRASVVRPIAFAHRVGRVDGRGERAGAVGAVGPRPTDGEGDRRRRRSGQSGDRLVGEGQAAVGLQPKVERPRCTAAVVGYGDVHRPGDAVGCARHLVDVDLGDCQIGERDRERPGTQRVVRSVAFADGIVLVGLDPDRQLTAVAEIERPRHVDGPLLRSALGGDREVGEIHGKRVDLVPGTAGGVVQPESEANRPGERIATAIVSQGHRALDPDLPVAGTGDVEGGILDNQVGQGDRLVARRGVVGLVTLTDVVERVEGDVDRVGTACAGDGPREEERLGAARRERERPTEVGERIGRGVAGRRLGHGDREVGVERKGSVAGVAHHDLDLAGSRNDPVAGTGERRRDVRGAELKVRHRDAIRSTLP